ncbi:annexin-B12-like [Macrobrachium rosenbergii]|uniref:annexin-B12-like n=1 Tax=Macrobrachium rosenbergii TaxID=79674 RepID=UPI0034D3F0F2
MTEETYKGTIVPKADFDAELACKQFKKAMKGIGTDENAIIRILVSHNNLQRTEIQEKYKEMFGQDLLDDLKEELGGHFEEAVVAMLIPPNDLLTSSLKEAFDGAGTDENALVDILCCKTPEELQSLCFYYEEANGRSLDDELESELTGEFQSLMRSLVAAGRDEDQTRDAVKARKDAQDLYDAGIGLNGESEASEFISILNTRSYPQLQEIFLAYENIAQESIENAISSEFDGDMKNGLLAIVQRVKDPLAFYATRIHQALDGAGTDDKTLIRILVSRSEIDLADIRKKYNELFDTDMAEDIKEDTGGDYGKLLVTIVNNS